ncbi:MAG: hypothetical protein MJ240_09525, partial [Kiritimatiellae bacterium]|nr:hypothetical protein [Kiritimatiellia bacterium]
MPPDMKPTTNTLRATRNRGITIITFISFERKRKSKFFKGGGSYFASICNHSSVILSNMTFRAPRSGLQPLP